MHYCLIPDLKIKFSFETEFKNFNVIFYKYNSYTNKQYVNKIRHKNRINID